MATKKIKVTSPKGIAKYPKLTKPDVKFKAEGLYSVKLLYTEDEAAAFIAVINNFVEESYEIACSEHKKECKSIKKEYPYANETDDDGNATGLIEIHFKKNASFKDKVTSEIINTPVALFDKAGKAITTPIAIYGGSLLKVNSTPSPYYAAVSKTAGVRLNINAVQVVSLVSGASGAYYGFDDEETDADKAQTTQESEDTPNTDF